MVCKGYKRNVQKLTWCFLSRTTTKIWWGLDSQRSLPSVSRPHGLTHFEVYEFVSVGEWMHKINLLKDFVNKYHILLPKDLALNFVVLIALQVRVRDLHAWDSSAIGFEKIRAGRLEPTASQKCRACSLCTEKNGIAFSPSLWGCSPTGAEKKSRSRGWLFPSFPCTHLLNFRKTSLLL